MDELTTQVSSPEVIWKQAFLKVSVMTYAQKSSLNIQFVAKVLDVQL